MCQHLPSRQASCYHHSLSDELVADQVNDQVNEAIVIVLHSITVACPRLLTVGDSVVLFAFLFFLILYGTPAVSLT